MTKEAFGINKPGGTRYRFGREEMRIVNVGIEGKKSFAEIESRRGKHGRYFFKQMYSKEEALHQKEKHEYLKLNGVRVPPVFKPITLGSGESAVLITDLTENDKYQVLGMNNPEVETDEFKRLALQIPPQRLEEIIQDMLHACEVAAGIGTKKADEYVRTYQFQQNAFLLRIDPTNPADARVFVADLGLDVRKVSKEEKDDRDQDAILKSNIYSAQLFYAWMTGKTFVIPDEKPYSAMNEEIEIDSLEILDYRMFPDVPGS